MDNINIKENILTCLSNIGIYTGDMNIRDESFSNTQLDEYIVDSLLFISFIVELEQIFDIEIEDEYLLPEKFQNINDIINLIELLKNDKFIMDIKVPT